MIVGGTLDVDSFHRALVVTAGLLVAGGLVSLAGIRDPRRPVADRTVTGAA